MDLQAQRDLRLLSEVEKDGGVTQRTLSNKLGVALGLTNLYLKRLAHKGYIKITTIPRNRIKYLLTPQGLAAKSRLTYEYMQYSLSYYRQVRSKLTQILVDLSSKGSKSVVIYGTGELAELAYLTLHEMGLTLVGVVDAKHDATFLSYRVFPTDVIGTWDFDVLLVTDLENIERVQIELAKLNVPNQKVIVPISSS